MWQKYVVSHESASLRFSSACSTIKALNARSLRPSLTADTDFPATSDQSRRNSGLECDRIDDDNGANRITRGTVLAHESATSVRPRVHLSRRACVNPLSRLNGRHLLTSLSRIFLTRPPVRLYSKQSRCRNVLCSELECPIYGNL